MSSEEKAIPKLFALAVEFAIKNGCPQPLNQLPGCWSHSFEHDGAKYWLAVNGHNEPREFQPPESMACSVPAFGIVFWRNGWIAGECDAHGGGLIGTDEDELIAAIESCGVQAGEA